MDNNNSLIDLDSSNLSDIAIGNEDRSLIQNTTGAAKQNLEEDAFIDTQGNSIERAGVSSILFNDEESNIIYSPIKQSTFIDEEPNVTYKNKAAAICPSNLDISRITVHEQERSEFLYENNTLNTSPLRLQSHLHETKESSRSALDFSIVPQSNQNNNEDEMVNEERLLIECMGNELAKLIYEKGSKDSIPLLSIICNDMNRSKAEMIVGRTIGRREWGKARRHSIFPGAGELVERNFWRNHRLKIENEQLIQFMEWLKAAGLIQNLSFGHKIVKYHNNLHVAIESVKRTDSLKNIVNRYYAEFLDVVNDIENIAEDEGNGMTTADKDIDSDISDYENEDKINPSSGTYNSNQFS